MVRTRIAPSPTGQDIHIGNLYTAILNYAWAKKNNGKFIIRIEDTDKTREVKGSAKKILNTLEQYGIVADESPLVGGPFAPYKQSKRLKLYKDYALKLIDSNNAYYCTCTKERLDNVRQQQVKNKKPPKYDKHCLNNQKSVREQIKNGTPYVIRLNVPQNQQIVVNDLLRQPVVFNTNDIDDQVLIKSDGYPTYHLAVVVDDNLMKVSHVIRAEEWLSSTPKHILLYNAFGFKLPVFVHTPLLRNSDKSKLSKRKNPVWASWYLQQGFLPEAVVNFLCLMGISHPQQKEKFNFTEFLSFFDIKNIEPAAPIFDLTKLEWLNGQYIKELKPKDFYEKVVQINPQLKSLEEEKFKKVLSQIQERVRTLAEVPNLIHFFYNTPDNFKEIVQMANNESKLSTQQTKEQIKQVLSTLEQVKDWDAKNIDNALHNLMETTAIKPRQFFMPIRIVVSGKQATPPLGDVLEILGKEETIKRINNYLDFTV